MAAESKGRYYHITTYELLREMKESMEIGHLALNAVRRKIMNYNRNFLTEQEQDSNRFLRFKEKAKKKIETFYRDNDDIFEEDDTEYLPFAVESLEDFIICLCWAKLTGSWDFADYLHDYAIEDDDTMEKMDLAEMEDFLLSIKEKREYTLHDIIDREFTLALKKHVSRRMAEDPTVEESNYVRMAMPDTIAEYLQIMDDTVNWVYVDIQRLFRSHFRDGLVKKGKEFLEQGLADAYLKKSKDLDEKAAALEAENEALKKEVARLKEEAKQACPEETEKLMDLMAEEQNDLARANQKLKSRYNGLYEKYQKLKKESETDMKGEVKEEQPIAEVDRNARFVFLAHENNAFQANLLKEFPNARFIADIADLSAEATDAVICISRHITHPAYYGVKAQCKTKKIPFLHTPSTNVDLIMEVISNYYNNLY